MECDGADNAGEKSIESSAVVNSVILDYYKKFGRKRDLEQFFSLSSAETEVRDVTSLFWRRMKSQTDSDSSEKKSKSESSAELCRISIKCSLPAEPCSSQDETVKTKSDSESPPIITEEGPSRHTDDESANDDNQSQKSIDAFLDTSGTKPLSPTSSITSQRKLEWDSLADVGYANESDRKTSASSLSTLERLALKQQYSNNDSKENIEIGLPTAHSTLMDINEDKHKSKKGGLRKTTKIYSKDVDIVEVSLPPGTETSPSQSINVNLTKHISFNMEKDGGVSVDNIKKDINISPEKFTVEQQVTPHKSNDKQIQTTLTKTEEKSVSPEINNQSTPQLCCQRVPVLINLNTLRKRYRKKKVMVTRRKVRNKKKVADKENIPVQEKSTEQVSAAESFEYMPGHVYNQNQLNIEQPRVLNMAGNKSSLESSAVVTTTESSKDSKHSFTKDLEKSIDILKTALRKSQDDSELKNKLIKEVVQRLLKSRYRDDDSTTDFLSGLSFSSKKLGLGESRGTTTTSTSDSNNTEVKSKTPRPKKSILRMDKFNPNILASTSQSAPNLPIASNSEMPIIPNLFKTITPKTESDISSGGKHSSETAFGKASSEELYQKYLEALKREEAYKRHLRDKEMFLKQKLVCSDTVFKVPQLDAKSNNKLKDLMKDLTRNNYDDGSGDASKLEGGSNANSDFQRYNVIRKPRSHSVFTLSSGGHSDDQNRKSNLKKKLQNEIKESQAGHSNEKHHHCCAHRSTVPKVGLTDSSVQVNINRESVERQRQQATAAMTCNSGESSRNSPSNIAHVVSDDATGEIKYVCLCNKNSVSKQEIPENMLIYKCSRLTKGVQIENTESKTSNTVGIQCVSNCQCRAKFDNINSCPSTVSKGKDYVNDDKIVKLIPVSNFDNTSDVDKMSKTSQTNMVLQMLQRKSSEQSLASSTSVGKKTRDTSPKSVNSVDLHSKIIVHEATRSVQTEISIDPNIADPSLTDINIINDQDCVQLISERFRETSKRSSETDIKYPKPNENIKPDTASVLAGKILRSGLCDKEEVQSNHDVCCTKKVDKEIQSDVELNNNEVQVNMNPPKEYDSDNFTIPIQGTNMTLMVRIGSKANKNVEENKREDFTTHCVGTDKVDISEKATNLREECSIGVQSQTTDIFTSMGLDLRSPRRNIVDKPTKYAKEDAVSKFNKSCLVNTCTGDTSVRNTYPRSVQVNPKSFLRSNTDSGRFMTGFGVQTESLETVDAVTHGLPSCGSEKAKDTESDAAKSKCCSDKGSKAGSIEESKDNTSCSQSRKSSSESDKDPILEIIRDITKRYSKKDFERSKKKKCFKEIVTVLNYLLDTEEGTDVEQINLTESSVCDRESDKVKKVQENPSCCNKNEESKKVDKAVQLSPKKSKASKHSTESSEIQATTDFPGTSTDSATCKVLNRIKKECEKYHQKRCKSHSAKKCEASSSTSVNCDQCKRVHHCHCRGHRCHKSKSSGEKHKKKCVAYNLIIQTSDSMISEETVCDNACNPLQDIVVKVPPKRKQMEKLPFKEVSAKIEKNIPRCSPRGNARTQRSRSCPNDSEISSVDDYGKRNNCGYTVRDYLERNRPDFMEKTTNRQQCLKIISEKRVEDTCPQPNTKMIVIHNPGCMRSMDTCSMYCGGVPMSCFNIDPYMQCVQSEVTRLANERDAQRKLLSAQLELQPTLSALSESELRRFARDFGIQLRTKKLAPKFINEREMKKHSEMIYKSLPEVVQKKEEIKKDNIKKTNLLMANIFKKNLQKKTLRGAVNISNYSAVVKI